MINRLLFVIEKYCDGDIRCGLTNSESMLVGAIGSTGLVSEIRQFHFDILCRQMGQRKMSNALLKECSAFRPDLVIFTPLFSQLDPTRDVIDKIAHVLGIKVYIHFFDGYRERVNSWLPYVNHAGIIDMLLTRLGYAGNTKVIQAYAVINPNDFYDKKLRKDIDISFVGSIDPQGVQWPLRSGCVRFLRENGINVVTCGGQRFNRISTEEYVNILNRSKISLNFCRRRDGASQLKCRVFEAMACQSFIIEDEGSETKEFFEPHKDYAMFYDKKELLEIVRYYLEHDAEREKVALSGYEKVTNIYNATNMWAYVFERMGFQLPARLANDKNYLLHQAKMELIAQLNSERNQSIHHIENNNTDITSKLLRYPSVCHKILNFIRYPHLRAYSVIGRIRSYEIRAFLVRINIPLERAYTLFFMKLASLRHIISSILKVTLKRR